MKDVEIGTIGEAKIYMKFDELVRIANKELQEHAKFIERHNSRLLYLLDVATEALKFYAELDGNGIQLYGDMDSKALEFVDGQSYPFGTKARETLKEIENDVFDGGRFKERRYSPRETLEVILDEAQKDEPCIQAIRAVAYTALKETKE